MDEAPVLLAVSPLLLVAEFARASAATAFCSHDGSRAIIRRCFADFAVDERPPATFRTVYIDDLPLTITSPLPITVTCRPLHARERKAGRAHPSSHRLDAVGRQIGSPSRLVVRAYHHGLLRSAHPLCHCDGD